MTWHNKVVWTEGMFLQPQHFQQQERYLERVLDARSRALAPYGWGFLQLTLDEAALALGKVAITAARGVFPDGTPLDIPGVDEAPMPLEFPATAKNERIVLGIPLRRAGAAEIAVGEQSGDQPTRYGARELEVADHTAGTDGRALLQLAQLRLRLLRSSEITDAYATLGVVTVVERKADNQLLLDKAYIAPMLAVDGSTLLAGFASEIHGLLHQRGQALASRLSQPGRGGVAEIADFVFLQTVNRYEPVFQHLCQVSPLHPQPLYQALLMLAGDLATFREERRPVAHPPYVHDDLALCFGPLMNDLRRSLSLVLEASAIPIELRERSYNVRVAVIPDISLVRTAGFILAVNAQVPGETLRTRFPAQVKIGPAEKLRDLVNLQLPGIVLRPLPVAPRQIPYHAGSYFEMERSGDLWKQLERSGGLAMHIAGEFPGLELECWAIRQ
jgi:type VI secretion system protein ImpJ